MSANETITHDTVRDFLVKNNGKVKNIDLVHHFRQQLNDPVNKSKVRGEFKEIVNTIATVQAIDGEKYFVLKRPKEAPAVLRKPPRPTKQRDRPVSGPPAFRGAKLEEMPGGSVMHIRQHSRDGSPDLGHSNKENDKPAERKESRGERPMSINGSAVDSGVDTDSSSSVGSITESSTVQMLKKQFLNSGKLASSVGQSTDGLSCSNDDLDRMDEDVEGDDLMGGPSAHLEPLEKEWFITAAKANRAQIMCLLEQDRNLATKRDFMLGYSALHWAAKHGRADIVKLLAGTHGIDVNGRTNGGYTPLHLAAMQGHDEVIKMLVSEYDADINCRDYSGKKPRQVARDGLTIESQALLEHFRSHSDSIDSSGYGSLYSKFGSTSSTPSVMLASQYSNSEKGSKNDASEDKNRSRSSSLGRFLMKKKGKKERGQVPSFPQSHTSAGLLISTPVSVELTSFEKSPSFSGRSFSFSNLSSTGV